MEKSPDAFRTISEVADWLGTPTHVLRFWESRFTQVKPVKRAGGRRYYRPADMALLGGIKKLLHEDGLTIRGVQKILREEGVKYVAAMSHPVDGEAVEEAPFEAMVEPAAQSAEVVDLARARGRAGGTAPDSKAESPAGSDGQADTPDLFAAAPPVSEETGKDPVAAPAPPAAPADGYEITLALWAGATPSTEALRPHVEALTALRARMTKDRPARHKD